MKFCSKCSATKPLDQYFRCAAKADGVQVWCKACMKAKAATWRRANPEPARERAKKWNAANPGKVLERVKAWAAANPQAARKNRRAWAERNPDAIRAVHTDRRERTRRSRVRWDPELDHFVISEAASLARRREATLGGAWHVDHIVPIRGRTASGLHNAHNLAVVPATYNHRKSNKLIEGVTPWEWLGC